MIILLLFIIMLFISPRIALLILLLAINPMLVLLWLLVWLAIKL
ncbi:membrane protein [Lactococcus phage FB3]|nr:membrane protein [Lactococcus phage FB3]QPL22688.1 membrane protein [Lactococcus phage FB14]